MNIGIDLGGTNIRLGVIENASILKKNVFHVHPTKMPKKS